MRSLSFIYVSVLLVQIGLGVLTPLVPLILIAQGAPKHAIGVVAAAYYFGMLCGSRFMSQIISTIGHVCTFSIFCAVIADAILLMHDANAVYFWIVLRIATGFGMIGIFAVIESWINSIVTTKTRGRGFGLYLIFSASGSAAGVSLMHYITTASTLLDIACGGIISSILPISALTRKSPAILPRARLKFITLFRLSPIGAATCFTYGFATSSFYSMMPVVLKDMSIPDSTISALLASCLFAGLIMQYPTWTLADRYGRRRITILALCLGALNAFIMIFVHGADAIFCFAIAYCACTAVLYGLGTGQLVERANAEQLVGASAALLFTWALGSCSGPIIASYVMSFSDDKSLFVVLFSILSCVAAFATFGLKAYQDTQTDSPNTYSTMPPLPELSLKDDR